MKIGTKAKYASPTSTPVHGVIVSGPYAAGDGERVDFRVDDHNHPNYTRGSVISIPAHSPQLRQR